MYPVIYDFGVVDLFGFQFRLAIYSFGLMLVAAFYTCYFLLDKDLRELGYDEKLASDIIFWSALGGIVGSKVYHVIENLDQIMSSNNPMSLIFSGSGLVFLVVLVGAIIAVTVVLNKIMVFHLNYRGPCHSLKVCHQLQPQFLHISFLGLIYQIYQQV